MELTQKEIQLIQKQVSPVVRRAESYEVKTKENVEEASNYLLKIREVEKAIEAKRLEFTKPINQSLKAINSTFKELSSPLEKARKLLTDKILDWRRKEQERIAAEEAKRMEEVRKLQSKGIEVPELPTIEKTEATIGKTQARKVWTFMVEDFSKVPDIYKMINNVAVNDAIRNGHRIIPGLKIYQEEILAIRR